LPSKSCTQDSTATGNQAARQTGKRRVRLLRWAIRYVCSAAFLLHTTTHMLSG
jgi:hypothetical protein